MPELPEVQVIVDDLNKKVIGRKIVGAWTDAPKLLKQLSFKEFEKGIKGAEIKEIKRRAKNILIYLDRDRLLLVHQKLTGHLLVGRWENSHGRWVSLIKGALEERVNDYLHLIFYLDNGEMLALSDLRKFAKVLFGSRSKIENSPDISKNGPEPLESDFTFEKFKEIISREKRKIKQVLMDQEVIAGIGNIYSDEILWEAKIHPFIPANKLTPEELEKIYKEIKRVLKKALELRGTSTSDFRDTAGISGRFGEVLKAYRREGKPCPRCGAIIKRIKLGGRSAHFCPVCQKK